MLALTCSQPRVHMVYMLASANEKLSQTITVGVRTFDTPAPRSSLQSVGPGAECAQPSGVLLPCQFARM
jgi:hypothetical protein